MRINNSTIKPTVMKHSRADQQNNFDVTTGINRPTVRWLFTLFVGLMCFSTEIAAQQKLKIATSQFPVTADVLENANYIKRFIREAASNGADLIQFSEQALCGYPPGDLPSSENFNWDLIRVQTKEIMKLAKEHHIWVALGSAHFISKTEKPLNSLYIISDEGKIVDRYDKSMLTGGDGDVNHYTAGNHTVVLELKGFKIGFLICYDSCFPEMYNTYRHQDVTIMIHSFYNAHHKGRTILDDVIPAEIRVRASDNMMWVIAANSSGEYSSWPTCIARPDGSLESLERGKPGLLYREFPDDQVTKKFRSWTHNTKPMVLPADEVYNNGVPSTHPRATDRKSQP